MKHIVSLTSAAFILALQVNPAFEQACKNPDYTFRPVSNSQEYLDAARVAAEQLCVVVADQIALYR